MSRPIVKVQNDSPVSNTLKVSVNDEIIPVYEATVRFKVGQFATLELKVPADMVDVEVLQKNTEMTVVPLEAE